MVKELSFRERLSNAVLRRSVDRVPALSVTQTGTLELMNICGFSWPEAHINSKAMANLAFAAYEIAGFEAVRVPFGMYVEAEAMGCKIDYHEGRRDYTPTVVAPLKNFNSLRVVEPTEGKMPIVIDAVKYLRDTVDETVPIIAGVTAPFNLAGAIQGVDKQMRLLITHPDEVHRVLEVTWEVTANFSNALYEAGADIIALLEPTVSTIGPKFFSMYALPYLKKTLKKIKCATVLHICGNAKPILEPIAASGAKGLSIDHMVDIKSAKEVTNGKLSIIGNIDPVAVMLDGKSEDIDSQCKKIIEEGVDILSPGCGLSPYTPIINMKTMVEAAKKYGQKKGLT